MDFDGFAAYDFDRDLEAKTGVEIEIAPSRFLTIKREGGSNRAYRAALQPLVEPYQGILANGGKIDDDVWEDLVMKAYSQAIVTGWRNITSNGSDVPFSADACYQFFKRFPERFEFVVAQANNLANFRRKARDDAAKN